jgi:hypothetical protein
MTDASTTFAIFYSWIKKGESDSNSFDAFISFFIAFNCYYSHMTNENNDAEAHKKLVADPDIQLAYSNLFAHEADLIKSIKKITPITDMRIGKSGNKKDVTTFSLEEIIGVLYMVRCNLFHGSKGGDSKRDREIVEICAPIVKRIACQFFEKVPLKP